MERGRGMTLRHLRVFLAVVDSGSMSAAARALYIAQPSVSGAIAELEAHYDALLFDRIGRRLVITPAGERLAGYARRLLALSDDMETTMRNGVDSLRVSLGATMTVGACVMSALVRQLQARCPAVQCQVRVENSSVIEERMLQSELDMALVEGTIKHAEIVSRPVIRDRLALVDAAGGVLQGRESIRLCELEGLPFVLRERGSGTRELFEQALVARGVAIQERWTCVSAQSIVSAVSAGLGLTVISRRLVEEELRRGTLREIAVEDAAFERSFSLCCHKDKFLSPPLREFSRLCEEWGEKER